MSQGTTYNWAQSIWADSCFAPELFHQHGYYPYARSPSPMQPTKDNLANKPAPRRAQQARSRETRRKIIRSAIHLLQTQGYQKTRLQDIAQGAGLTLGALQHHFGSRQVLMEQVVDEVMAPLANLTAGWPVQAHQQPLAERAHNFVRSAWDNVYGTPRYIAAWSLFFGARKTALFARIEAHRARHDPIYNAHFVDTFPEIVQHHGQAELLAETIFAALRGLAIMQLFSEQPQQLDIQLELLAQQITQAGQGQTA